jgi:hypothetical protein
MKAKNDCKTCRAALPDLLMDSGYAEVHPEAAEHIVGCGECRTEFIELRRTYALLDEWSAPEPSPYFDAKLRVRLREAAAAGPEGLWERMRSFLMFSTGRHLGPAMAGVLGFALLLGGGTFAGMYRHQAPHVQAASPTIDDLKIMNNNAQALQQMDQLLDDSAQNTDDSSGPPTT